MEILLHSLHAQASKLLHTICLLCLHWKQHKARSSSSFVRYNSMNIIKLLKKAPHEREHEKYSTKGQNDENNC